MLLTTAVALTCTVNDAGADKPSPPNISLEEPFEKIGVLPGPFVVHLHCGDGKLTCGLLKREGVVVQGLDTNRTNVETARRDATLREDYGSRITFRWFDGTNLPYVDNLVNHIVATGACRVSREELMRVLAPGGVAIIEGKVTVKRRPSDIDEWTHHMHGPDNNRVSRDTRLEPPLSHLQWTASPRFTRHHEHMSSFQAMVSDGGKIFYIIDEGSKDTVLLPPDWNLIARDAFNGIELWRRKLDHWFNHLWPFKSGPLTVTRRLVAQEDRVFAALEMGGGVAVLDANTGALLYELPGTEGAEEIIVDGDRLFVAQRQWLVEADKFEVRTKVTSGGTAAKMTRDFSWNAAAGRQQVAAFDWASKKRLWQKETPVAPFGLGARDGHVYIFDGEQVLSIEADSGQVNWTSPKVGKTRAQFSTGAGCSLVCGKERILLGGAGENMIALSVRDGTILWQAAQYASGRHSPKDLFLIDGKAWTAATLGSSMTLPGVPSTAKRKSGRITGYHLEDGTVAADFYTDSDVYIMNSRCHMSCATAGYLITSRTGAELVSLKDQKWNLHHWLRGSCLYGLMPANGMLYAPPNPCACYTQSGLDGFNAVTGGQPGWTSLTETPGSEVFTQGTARFDNPVSDTTEPQAWPVYRHDNKRSGSTPVNVALPLAIGWRVEGYENLTGLVVANEVCVFAEKDRHTVHALDARNGDARWSYVAGGRIDSPPTISGNSMYFGCADGWLYRLLVSTGELVWKRRIAPADRSLFDHGQPASAWPLSGSVLVQGGKVYCVAGRSAFLDGGMRLVLVDAETGDILEEQVMDDRDPDNEQDMHQHVAMQNMPVGMPDLLSSDGEHLYMLSQQFDLSGKRTHVKNSAWDDDIEIGVGREHLFAATGFLDDNWFHRTYWVYGNSFLEGCSVPSGGWFEMGRISPSGKMLCFDDTTVYGYGQFPEYSKWSTPLQYTLFAVNKKPSSYQPGVPDEELRKTRPNWRTYRSRRVPEVEFDVQWKSSVPVRAKALVKTPGTLFVAGPEDLLDEENIFQDARGPANRKLLNKQNELINARKGGKLLAVAAKDGRVQQVIELGSQPVWDGMAVAYRKLFMCCRDGSVVALNTSNDSSLLLKESRSVPNEVVLKETKTFSGTPSTLRKIGGRIAVVSSFESHRRPEHMLDGDPSTFWHTRFEGGDAQPPHYVVLQVPAGTRVGGLTYAAWTGGNGNGHVKEYAVSVSDDGKNWGAPILSGGLKTDTSGRQTILFPALSTKPFIKFGVTASKSNRGRFLAAVGELDIVVAAPSQESATSGPIRRKPNVLFILADDLGWRDLGCYGNKLHETPNLDKLAGRGMRFTDAYAACPICGPSRAAILTGKFPSNTGFVDNFFDRSKAKTLENRPYVKLEEITLAEALKEGGYQTAFLGKWHLSGSDTERLPTDQGFDVNVAGCSMGAPGRGGYFSPYNIPESVLEDGPVGEYLPDRLTSEAIGVLDRFSRSGKPWLLYMSYYTVHAPIVGKPEKSRKYRDKTEASGIKLHGRMSHVYAGMVESLDENVGRMLDWLDEKGLRDDTIVIFTSDNGGHKPVTHQRPLRSYKGDLYEGGIRVPLIIDWPSGSKPGSVSDTPVHGVDCYATILEMAGLPRKPEQHQDSVSLVPLLEGDATFKRGPMVWHYPVSPPQMPFAKPGSVIRDGTWKYIHFHNGLRELYNLKDDIGETKNLVPSMPEKAAEMDARLEAMLKAHGTEIPASAPAKAHVPARKKRAKKSTGNSGK